jgi:hypothetical protein
MSGNWSGAISHHILGTRFTKKNSFAIFGTYKMGKRFYFFAKNGKPLSQHYLSFQLVPLYYIWADYHKLGHVYGHEHGHLA